MTVGVAHVVWPHLKIDLISVGLLVVGVLPWLDGLFKSIQTPFGGVEYRDMERRLDELTGETQSARRIAETGEARELARQDARFAGSAESLAELAAEYDRTRADMSPGDARTNAMTTLVGRMISAVESGEEADVRDFLGSGRRGLRLVAYVSLYVRPDTAMLIPLVDSLIDLEDKPFGQYWALRSLRRVIASGGHDLMDNNTLRRLRNLYRGLPSGSDRGYELGRILEGF
ncbi:hypothetical protein [Streptomyces sp. NPDC049040]|uniref:hypothetical protein n=1 Tax=Streptomyces sp. NPDC049040 TaxID=3365593 RepID=UPI00371952E2